MNQLILLFRISLLLSILLLQNILSLYYYCLSQFNLVLLLEVFDKVACSIV